MFETIIFTIIWGYFIGVFVSAPMGPTGILVIQRTLNKGMLPGLLTGLGAVLSDLFYALICTFAIGLVVDWIQPYEVTLQFVGSTCILFYAYYLWRSNPAANIGNKERLVEQMPQRVQASGILKNFFSGLGITLLNPLIVFYYLILFARTNFLFDADADHPWLYGIGFGCLLLGAVSWWVLITWSISKIRNHFKIRTLSIINRVIAGIMCGVALYGFGNGFYILATR